MKTEFLTPKDGAKFSPAEKHLATLLRSLKSFYTDKESFYKHFMVKVDEKAFTKSETERIWDAMHNVAYWDNDAQKHVTPMTSNHKLFFPPRCYSNGSNFFEDYAKQIFEEGNIVQQRGRVKGKIYPDTLTHLADMRAAKAAKKSGIVHEDIFHVEPPKEEEKPASNLFDGLSLSELEQAQAELAVAIKNRQNEIRGLYTSLKGQIADLERQVTDLEAKNPWLLK